MFLSTPWPLQRILLNNLQVYLTNNSNYIRFLKLGRTHEVQHSFPCPAAAAAGGGGAGRVSQPQCLPAGPVPGLCPVVAAGTRSLRQKKSGRRGREEEERDGRAGCGSIAGELQTGGRWISKRH